MSKKFYIVGMNHGTNGIGAIIFPVLSVISYAIDNGFTPIVDLKHYQNQYFKDGRTFRDNTWEYYFEQPCGYTLDDITDEDEIKFCSGQKSEKTYAFYSNKHLHNINKSSKAKEKIMHCKELYSKYLKFNKQTQEYVEKICEEKLQGNKNVLGVLCRGTDYIQRQPYNDPIQPNPKKVLKDAKKLMAKRGYEKIYLATEDAQIYKMFKDEFGDKLIENSQYMYDENYDSSKYLSQIKVDRPNHNYQLGLEYLASLYVLSKCKGFLGGPTSGSKTAFILSDNWDYRYIYYYGIYGKYNHFWERIFSIKNKVMGNNDKIKIVTLFGIKIRLSKKSYKAS